MKKKENPDIIFTAALKIFAQFGFKKTTMEDIASELGMTKGNLYLYSKNKGSLYKDMVSWALRRWQTRVSEAVSKQENIQKKFLVLCQKSVEYLSQDSLLHGILVNDPGIFPMFPDDDPYEAINRNSMTMIQNILEQGIREGIFRPVDTARVAEVMFLIYKIFIIQKYIKGKKNHINQMLSETIVLLTRGLFLAESSDPKEVKDDTIEIPEP